MFESCRRCLRAVVPAAGMLFSLSLIPSAASAQTVTDEALIASVSIGALNDTYVEPALDYPPMVVEMTVVFDPDEFELAFADRTHYVLEYGYYEGSAQCGLDFEFWRPRSSPGPCRTTSHTWAIPTARQGVTIPVAGILPDAVPEFPNESFTLWVRVADRPGSQKQTPVFIESNPLPIHLMGLASINLLYPTAGQSVFEGESIWFRVALSRAVNREVCVHVRAGQGSARAGRDFVPLAQRVCLSPYKLVSDVIQVRTLRDDLPRSSRSVSILLEARYPGNPDVYHMGSVGVVIMDATEDLGDLNPSSLWFGPSRHSPRSCASGAQVPLVLVEPEDPSRPATYVVDFVFRRRPAGGALNCVGVDAALPVTVRPDGDFLRGAPAHPGLDFEIAPRAGVVPHTRFEFTVVQDGVDEVREHGVVRVNAGKYGSFHVPVVVLDWRYAADFVASGEADYAAMARLAGTILAGAVAQRFSCASSGRCGRAAADIRGFAADAGRRLAGVVASAAGSRSPFGLDPLGDLFASGPGAAGRGGHSATFAHRAFGPPGAGGHAAPGGSGLAFGGPAASLSGLSSSILRSVGAVGDAPISFQVRPGVVRNAARGPVWSAWFRGVDRRSDVSVGDALNVRSSVLGILGGFDRQAGGLTVGTAYGLLHGDVESRESAASAGRLQVSGSWHLLAPYFGYRPNARLRFWGLSGLSIRATSNPIDVVDSPSDERGLLLGFRPMDPFEGRPVDLEGVEVPLGTEADGSPAVRVNAVGLSATVLDAGWGVVDVEADELRSRATPPRGRGYDPRTSLSDSLFYTPVDTRHLPSWSGRAAVRRRVGVRVGVPVATASRLVWHTAARWDSGPDVEHLLAGTPASTIRAVDAGVEFRAAPARARVSMILRYQLELSSTLADHVPGAASSRHAFDVGLRFGAAESQAGWVLEVSPGYGYPTPASSLLLGGDVPEALASSPSAFLPSVPLLDLGLGYGFRDGSRVLLSGSRYFGDRRAAGRLPAQSGLPFLYPGADAGSMRLAYQRRW